MDMLRSAGNAPDDAADAPDDEIHMHPGIRRLHEFFDEDLVGNGIELQPDVAVQPFGCPADLLIDQL